MAQGGQVCFRTKGDDCCPYHQGHKVMLQCLSCEGALVCGMCITTLHKDHKFEQPTFGLTEKVEQIKQHIKKSETNTLPELEMKISSGSKTHQDVEDSYAIEIQGARRQGIQLKEKLDLITAKKVSLLEIRKKEDLDLVEKHIERIKKSKLELQNETRESKVAITSNNNILLLDTATEIMKGKKTPKMPDISIAHFIPCKNPDLLLEKAFGIIEEISEIDDNAHITNQHSTLVFRKNLKKLTEFKTHMFASIRFLSKDLAWIYGRDSGKLELFDQTGELKETLVLDVHIKKLCVHPVTKDLYLCAVGDKSVQRVDKNHNKTIELFRIQNEPAAMACTTDHFIIGMKSGLVCMYTFKGDIACYYDNFTARHIAVCHSTTSFALVSGTGEVVVLDSYLQVKYRYKAMVAAKGPAFESYSAGFDSYGHLLVVYRPNKEIHVLSAATGQLIEKIKTTEFPHVLAFAVLNDGVFWIGCDSRTVMCIKYADIK